MEQKSKIKNQKSKLHFKIQKFRFWFATLIFTFYILNLYAMDADLWNLPLPPKSNIIWEDRDVEINGIDARGTHLRSQLKVEEVINFYKESLLRNGWQIKDNFLEQNIISFIKGERFMYVAVQDNGQDIPSDAYLISSPSDLALCKIIASYMKENLMQQDAPGKDIADIPRYPASKRMISIFAPEEGAILLYQATDKPKDILKFYQSHLQTNGWELIQALKPEFLQKLIPGAQNIGILVLEKDNDTLVINVNPINIEGPNKLNMVAIVKNMLDEFAYPIEEDK